MARTVSNFEKFACYVRSLRFYTMNVPSAGYGNDTIMFWRTKGRASNEKGDGLKRATGSTGGIVMLALSAALGVAMAADEPALKEGLWSVHTQTASNPGNKRAEGNYVICRNHAFDESVRLRAKAQKSCAVATKNVGPGTFSNTSHCSVAGTTIDSTGITTYTGDTATHSESSGVYTPPMSGIANISLIMDQKYIGSCPAGLKPGDRKDPNGSVAHIGGPAK